MLLGPDVASRQEGGQNEFSGGKEDFTGAAAIACSCLEFVPDDSDEWVADEARSCYNCRARRWTRDSFICLRRLI